MCIFVRSLHLYSASSLTELITCNCTH